MLLKDSLCYFQPKIVVLLSCKQMRDEEINFLILEEMEAESNIIFGLTGLQPFLISVKMTINSF